MLIWAVLYLMEVSTFWWASTCWAATQRTCNLLSRSLNFLRVTFVRAMSVSVNMNGRTEARGHESNKPFALDAFVDTFTQAIESSAPCGGSFTASDAFIRFHSSCSSFTERSKAFDAFLVAPMSFSSLIFSGESLKNCLTSRSYLVKTAMMGMLTKKTISHWSINQKRHSYIFSLVPEASRHHVVVTFLRSVA